MMLDFLLTIIFIFIIGIVSIVSIKLYYNDNEEKIQEKQKIFTKFWQEPLDQTKLVEKPKKERIATRIFQEPMTTSHKNLINNRKFIKKIYSENVDVTLNKDNNIIKKDDLVDNHNVDINEKKITKNYHITEVDEKNTKDIHHNHHNNNIQTKENNNTHNFINLNKEYDSFEDVIKDLYKNNDLENFDNSLNNSNSNVNSFKNTDYKNKDNPKFEFFTDTIKSKSNNLKKTKIIIIKGQTYELNLKDDIIFDYNNESYSSEVLDIKHGNVKVKYRNQEKWINIGDIKRIL